MVQKVRTLPTITMPGALELRGDVLSRGVQSFIVPYITRADRLGKLSNVSLEKITRFCLGRRQRIELSLETLAGHARREATVPGHDGCQEGAEENSPPPLPLLVSCGRFLLGRVHPQRFFP